MVALENFFGSTYRELLGKWPSDKKGISVLTECKYSISNPLLPRKISLVRSTNDPQRSSKCLTQKAK